LTSSDILVLSSTEPFKYDWKLIEERLKFIQSLPDIKDVKEIRDIYSVEEFFYRNIANETTIKKFLMDESQLNLDNLPIIEFRTPKFVFEDRVKYIRQQLMIENSPIDIYIKNSITVDDTGYHFLPIALVYKDNYVEIKRTILNIKKRKAKKVNYLIDFIGDIRYLTNFSTRNCDYQILSMRRSFTNREIFKKNLDFYNIKIDIPENYHNLKRFNIKKNGIIWYNHDKGFLWIILKNKPFTEDDVNRFMIEENNYE
jgi:hypothetical protein